MNDLQPDRRSWAGWLWLAVGAAAGLILAYELWLKPPPTPILPTFRTERFGFPQNSVTVAKTQTAKDAAGLISDDELVLSVTVANETRAYPLNMMYAAPETKALNDTVGSRPLLITWCEKCMSGVVFDREVDGQTLTFAIFGSLWLDTIVLHDTETWSQWSQWDGEAKLGPYAGRTLSPVPSVILDCKSWRAQHPAGTVAVLEAKRDRFHRDAYADAGQFLLVAGDGKTAKTWELAEVVQKRVINDSLAGEPVAAVFVEAGGTARLFGRRLGNETLTLAWREGQLRDIETESAWSPLTGKAISGPKHGQTLAALPSRLCTRAVGKRFFPLTLNSP